MGLLFTVEMIDSVVRCGICILFVMLPGAVLPWCRYHYVDAGILVFSQQNTFAFSTLALLLLRIPTRGILQLAGSLCVEQKVLATVD